MYCRFACRILCSREGPDYAARIFAAGFDSSRNIFLGEKATKWETEHQVGIIVNVFIYLKVHLIHFRKTQVFVINETWWLIGYEMWWGTGIGYLMW